MQVQALVRKIPGEGHSNHSVILARKIAWTEEPGEYGSWVAKSGTTRVTGHSMTHSCQAVGAFPSGSVAIPLAMQEMHV